MQMVFGHGICETVDISTDRMRITMNLATRGLVGVL